MARGVDQSIPDSLGSRPQKLRFIVDPKLWAAYISVRMHGHWKDEGDREYGNSESIKSLDCEMVKGVKALSHTSPATWVPSTDKGRTEN